MLRGNNRQFALSEIQKFQSRNGVRSEVARKMHVEPQTETGEGPLRRAGVRTPPDPELQAEEAEGEARQDTHEQSLHELPQGVSEEARLRPGRREGRRQGRLRVEVAPGVREGQVQGWREAVQGEVELQGFEPGLRLQEEEEVLQQETQELLRTEEAQKVLLLLEKMKMTRRMEIFREIKYSR